MYAIEVNNLVKEYKVVKKEKGLYGAVKNLFHQEVKSVRAVDDISFQIEKGDIVAYIGPNGAGKSTTIKMMSGIMRPTSGEIMIEGISPQKNRKQVAGNIGVVFGQRSQLNWDLRLEESFELLKRIYQIDQSAYRRKIEMMDEILNISEFMDTPVRQLSLGQRMRGDLVAAMLHSPGILFLDEPTIGLDVEAKHSIRRFIKEINEQSRTTIILTTHDLGDVQELCRRIIIIDGGRIIEDGALEELIDKISPYRFLCVDYTHPFQAVGHEKAEIVSESEMRTVYKFKKAEITTVQLIQDIAQKSPVKEVSIKESDIDDVIRTVYQKHKL